MSVANVGIKAELLRSKLFDTAINRLALSARAYDRTLQGAKTIGRTRRIEKYLLTASQKLYILERFKGI